MQQQETDILNELFDRLFPICRSIMGEGYRKSMEILKEYIPFNILRFSTGSKVLNWTVPKEWVIREAWIKDPNGDKIIDIKENNLHVINYSDSVHKTIDLKELKEHLYTREDLPNAIPYVTSYYKKKWGFCMKYSQYENLQEGEYEVYIDSEFVDGTLDIGEIVLKGESDKEVVLTSYLCHPSMANNELSGPLVLTMLYRRIAKWEKRNLTYRFVINPETIGAICYLSQYGKYFKEKMYAGMVLNCMGGSGSLHYKTSRRENSPFDLLIRRINDSHEIECPSTLFFPMSGSDERQYCSPGFNLPYGQMSRVMSYKEYHNSLDTKEFMGIGNISKSIEEMEDILKLIDKDGFYVNKYPYGEVKLSDYGLYPTTNSYGNFNYKLGKVDSLEKVNMILAILSYSDGRYRPSYIAERYRMKIGQVIDMVDILKKEGILEGPYFERQQEICTKEEL